jgi:DNA-binding MarR family transcriptional regulator
MPDHPLPGNQPSPGNQPPPGNQPLPEADEESLAEAFWSVTRRLRHLTHRTVTPLGITPGQARAIGVLRRHGGIRLSDLAEHLRIAPRSTTEVIDALQELGLAERTPDPADRRATLVTLTAEGQDVAAAVGSARHAEAEAFFGRLSETDREALARILKQLRTN